MGPFETYSPPCDWTHLQMRGDTIELPHTWERLKIKPEYTLCENLLHWDSKATIIRVFYKGDFLDDFILPSRFHYICPIYLMHPEGKKQLSAWLRLSCVGVGDPRKVGDKFPLFLPIPDIVIEGRLIWMHKEELWKWDKEKYLLVCRYDQEQDIVQLRIFIREFIMDRERSLILDREIKPYDFLFDKEKRDAFTEPVEWLKEVKPEYHRPPNKFCEGCDNSSNWVSFEDICVNGPGTFKPSNRPKVLYCKVCKGRVAVVLPDGSIKKDDR